MKTFQELEAKFEKEKYLSVHERKDLARRMGLSDTQIKTWYQNRRSPSLRKFFKTQRKFNFLDEILEKINAGKIKRGKKLQLVVKMHFMAESLK